MKSILIPMNPRFCARIMNGDKIIDIRKSKVLYEATKKLIDEYGYAEFYVYCSKNGGNLVYGTEYRGGSFIDEYGITMGYSKQEASEIFGLLNGKVLFKFRCYKVEEWDIWQKDLEEKLKLACLSIKEFDDYSKGQVAYAIRISDLEIFDEPRELSEFKTFNTYDLGDLHNCHLSLTKAPQNFYYIEVE